MNTKRFILVFSLFFLLTILKATDHKFPVMEPYQLSGKRLVFTNWFYVRTGHFHWVDDEGKNVFTSKTAELDETQAHFIPFDYPYGIRLFAEPAQREIPNIPTEKPWDKWGIRPAMLIHEDGRFRLWGSCNSDNLHSRACYFESKDGIFWEKPNLGLVEYKGSFENNLLKSGAGSSLFVDTHAPPGERYKAMWHDRIPFEEFEKYQDTREWSYYALELDAPLVHVLKGAYSPDGFHWTILEDPIAFEHADTQSLGYYDEKLGKYVIYTRSHMVGSRAPGIPYPEKKFHQRISRRAVGRMESETFLEFPLSEIIIETESDMHPADQFYTNCYTTIPGAPDHHLMFPTLYNYGDDDTDVLLYSSYNGKNWHKVPGPPVLADQPFGQTDGGCFFASPNLVERSNGDWIMPYVGYNVPHKYPRGAYRFEPGLLVWPKGRLVGIEAQEIGEFATVAFLLPGEKLKINALTQRAGYIRIELVEFDGKPVDGFSFEESDPIIGNHYWTVVSWGGKEKLDLKTGTPIWFRFRIKMAKIYGLEFE
jgi:hypothetical protein